MNDKPAQKTAPKFPVRMKWGGLVTIWLSVILVMTPLVPAQSSGGTPGYLEDFLDTIDPFWYSSGANSYNITGGALVVESGGSWGKFFLNASATATNAEAWSFTLDYFVSYVSPYGGWALYPYESSVNTIPQALGIQWTSTGTNLRLWCGNTANDEGAVHLEDLQGQAIIQYYPGNNTVTCNYPELGFSYNTASINTGVDEFWMGRIGASNDEDFAITNLVWDADDGFISPIVSTPLTPAGLSGLVTETAAPQSSITFEFPVSANDPNQDSGSLTYRLYRNGINVANDTLDAQDTAGIRTMIYTGSTGGTNTYRVSAFNATTGLESPLSCSITLNEATLDEDECGQPPNGQSLFGQNSPLWGGNKTAFAETLSISEPALDLLYAFIFIVIFGVIGFAAFNSAGAITGVAAGLIWAFAWGIIPTWALFFLIIFAVAAFILRRRNG